MPEGPVGYPPAPPARERIFCPSPPQGHLGTAPAASRNSGADFRLSPGMDAKKPASHPFRRLSLPHQPPALPPPAPPALPPPAPQARRPAEGETPIFDQLLKEWRSGEIRPVVSWPVDDPGKIGTGARVGTDDGRPYPRTRDKEHDREPVRTPPAHPDR